MHIATSNRCLPPHANHGDPREVLQTLRPEEWERQNEAIGPFVCYALERTKRDGFSPRTEPPPSHLSARDLTRSGRLLFALPLRKSHRTGTLIFANLMTLVAADSDLTKPPKGELLKGGDPATPSGTATLLRLHPSHRPLLRRLRPLRVRPATSGATDSSDVTGGECKARERIHRSVLTCGY